MNVYQVHVSSYAYGHMTPNRMFRWLAAQRTMGKAIRSAEKRKGRQYDGVEEVVIPLALTSLGAVSSLFRQLVVDMCVQLDPDGTDIGEQSRFAKNLLHRLSVIMGHTVFRLANASSA